MDGCDVIFDSKVENAIEQYLRLTFEPIFNSGLKFPFSRYSLDQIRDMHHRIEAVARPHEIRGCNLTGFTELLLMPYDIVIKKQRLGKLVNYRAIRIDYDFPQLIELHCPLHPVGELETIRSAFSQKVDFVRKKCLFL